jgi:hypothetical protein
VNRNKKMVDRDKNSNDNFDQVRKLMTKNEY